MTAQPRATKGDLVTAWSTIRRRVLPIAAMLAPSGDEEHTIFVRPEAGQ